MADAKPRRYPLDIVIHCDLLWQRWHEDLEENPEYPEEASDGLQSSVELILKRMADEAVTVAIEEGATPEPSPSDLLLRDLRRVRQGLPPHVPTQREHLAQRLHGCVGTIQGNLELIIDQDDAQVLAWLDAIFLMLATAVEAGACAERLRNGQNGETTRTAHDEIEKFKQNLKIGPLADYGCSEEYRQECHAYWKDEAQRLWQERPEQSVTAIATIIAKEGRYTKRDRKGESTGVGFGAATIARVIKRLKPQKP